MQSDSSAIRDHLTRYLSGSVTLEDFIRWFRSTCYEMDLDDIATAVLYGDVELALAEYANGDWTEDEFRLLLRPLAVPDDDSAAAAKESRRAS